MSHRTLLTVVVLLMLCGFAATQDNTDPERAIQLFEAATRNVRTYDLWVEATVKILFHSETRKLENGTSREVVRKLGADEAPAVMKEYSRQVFDQGKGRIELFAGPAGKAKAILTYDDEEGRVRDVSGGGAILSRRVRAISMVGADYRETFRSVLTGTLFDNLVRCLRQRKGFVIVHPPSPNSPYLILEAQPLPPASKLEADLARWGFKVMLDPAHGMMPAVIEVTQPGNGVMHLYRRTTVNSWKDIGNGVWVPTKATTIVYYVDNGKNPHMQGVPGNESILVVDVARSSWNRAISPETLRNPLPVGTKVTDTERSVRFVTGKADPGSNLDDLAKNARDVVPFFMYSGPEKTPWWIWALWSGGGVAGLATLLGGVWYLRKRLRNAV